MKYDDKLFMTRQIKHVALNWGLFKRYVAFTYETSLRVCLMIDDFAIDGSIYEFKVSENKSLWL